MDTRPDPLRPGAFWMECSTGRRIMILDPFAHNTGPLWTYVDSLGGLIPDSERHPDCYKHCSDIFDFSAFDQFVCEDDLLLCGLRPNDIVELTEEQLQKFSPLPRAAFILVQASRRQYATGWVPFARDGLQVDPVALGSLLFMGHVIQRPDGMLTIAERLVRMLAEVGAVRR